MNLVFNDLQTFLPEDTVQWGGFGEPLMLNLNNLTGEDLTPESPVLEVTAKFLQGLHSVVAQINADRAAESPPKPAIDTLNRELTNNEKGNPVHSFILHVEVDAAKSLDAVINPLETP